MQFQSNHQGFQLIHQLTRQSRGMGKKIWEKTREWERKFLLFPAEHGVGQKFLTFQLCPHLLCMKASLRSPETWCDYAVSLSKNSLFLSLKSWSKEGEQPVFVFCSFEGEPKSQKMPTFFFPCILEKNFPSSLAITFLATGVDIFSLPFLSYTANLRG